MARGVSVGIGIELLDLPLGQPAVEVDGRVGHQVALRVEADLAGVAAGLEDDGRDGFEGFVGRGAHGGFERARRDAGHPSAQLFATEIGHELVAAVVVMDAVGEPEALEVDGQTPVGTAGGELMPVDGFERAPDEQVARVVLVPHYVAAIERGLRQVEEQHLAHGRQTVEVRNLVAQDADVGEAIN